VYLIGVSGGLYLSIGCTSEVDMIVSMFKNGRFIIDLNILDVEETITKVSEFKYSSLDGTTEYYLFNDWSTR